MISTKGAVIAKKEANPGIYILILVKAIQTIKASKKKRYNKKLE